MGEKKLDEVFKIPATESTLDSVGFFAEFPPELKAKIKSFSEIIQLEEDQVVLKQGEVNNYLYFLLIGTVDIYVDGGVVASMSRKGDLLGEMSVITNKPCSATIVTKTPVNLLSIDAAEFKKITEGQDGHIEHVLYRIYANILTDKLNLTNQKAKVVEQTNAELQSAKVELETLNAGLEEKVKERTAELQKKTDDIVKFAQKMEQKNTELVASTKKIEEMYQTRDVTFDKLESLHSEELIPLHDTLKDIHDMSKGEFRETVSVGLQKIESVIKALQPLTESFSIEKSMKSKKVLFADSKRKRQVVAKMALGGTGVELEMAQDAEEVKKILLENPPDLVLVEAEQAELIDFIKSNYPQIKTVLMTSTDVQMYLDTLNNLTTIPNIVSRNEDDKTFTIKNIMTTVTKLSSKDIFGLEKYLNWGVEAQEFEVANSNQRGDLITDMHAYFKQFGVRSSILSNVSTVLEEILMNAIYDAPVDAEGNSIYNHLDRTNDVALKENERAELRYASDGTLLAVSVSDPFGSLDGSTILKYLISCYTGQEGSLNAEKGGAGRGLHQIIENSDLVVFNVSPNVKTEVIALFNLHKDKEASEKGPSFHYFVA